MEWNVASDRNRARQLNLTHATAPTDALLSNPLELERASLSDAENIFNVVQSSEFIKHNLGPHCITIRGDPTIAQYTNPSAKICARPIWEGITTENFVCFHVLCNKKERHRVFWRIFACLMVQWPACHQMIDQRERLPARLHAFLLQQQRARRTAEKPVLMCLPKLSASAFVMKFFLPISFFRFWIESILCFSFCLFVTSIAQSIHVSPNGRWSIRAMLRIQKRQQLKFLGFLRELPDGDAMQNYSVSFTAFARPPRGDRSVGRRNKATTNCELFYFHFTHFAAARRWSLLSMQIAYGQCFYAISPCRGSPRIHMWNSMDITANNGQTKIIIMKTFIFFSLFSVAYYAARRD